MSDQCPWCDAPVVPGPKCPKCGAIYAKAEAIRLHGRATTPDGDVEASAPVEIDSTVLPIDYVVEERAVADAVLEWKYCVFALPVTLLLGLVFHAFSLGHFLQRTFLSMPLHELGHAVTSWMCGYFAVPMLWVTHTAETRGVVTPVVVAALILYAIRYAMGKGYRVLAAAGFALLAAQVVGTLFLKKNATGALITFGGDAGAMVFGALLMTTFFYGKQTQLYKGSLRWGFLVIGAASFVDTFSTWWDASKDYTNIPIGEIEGVGLSDAARLIENFGWTQGALVHRYVGLGLLCMAILTGVWVWGMLSARDAMRLKAM